MNDTFNILFDRYGIQASTQLKTNSRLIGLTSAINAVSDWYYTIADGELSADALEGQDVLVLTTRHSQGYTADEISAIISFVQGGGGLWCMANHDAFNGSQLTNNFVRYTSAISSTFFASYQAAAYQNPNDDQVDLTGSNLLPHVTITGDDSFPLYRSNTTSAINTVVTRSFSAIYPDNFSDPVAGLADLDQVVNLQDGSPITSGVLWATALSDNSITGNGRVVICADSGWIADNTSDHPGPGEFHNGDNPQYCLNTLAWLGNYTPQ